MKIDIPDLTGVECGYIAITAAEGGIGHWSQIDEYKPSRWWPSLFGDLDLSDPGPIEVPDDFVFYTINEDIHDDGTYRGGPFDVTPATIRKGFELAVTEARADLVARLLTMVPREDWPGEIDADAADVIVQLGTVGEVRYG